MIFAYIFVNTNVKFINYWQYYQYRKAKEKKEKNSIINVSTCITMIYLLTLPWHPLAAARGKNSSKTEYIGQFNWLNRELFSFLVWFNLYKLLLTFELDSIWLTGLTRLSQLMNCDIQWNFINSVNFLKKNKIHILNLFSLKYSINLVFFESKCEV